MKLRGESLWKKALKNIPSEESTLFFLHKKLFMPAFML